MHVAQGSKYRHHDFTCNLVFCQVAASLSQLSIQVSSQGKLLHYIDTFVVLKGSIDLDNAWML